MSHHSVESMRDIAFRKGRHGFSSDDDYLRALRGEELEDEFLDEEDETPDDEFDDEENETPDEFDDEFDDEEDETLDEEDEESRLEDEEATRYWDDFESFLDDLLTDRAASANAINLLFRWVIAYDAGNRNAGISIAHRDTVLTLQPDVDDETPYVLKFKLTGGGRKDVTGGYDFTDLVDYLGLLVDEEDSPFNGICRMVNNELATADFHGDLGYVWRKRIAEFLACKPAESEAERGLVLKSKDGEDEDAHLEFKRKPHLLLGDTTWVFDGEPSREHPGRGCPTVLLQWLLCNHESLL